MPDNQGLYSNAGRKALKGLGSFRRVVARITSVWCWANCLGRRRKPKPSEREEEETEAQSERPIDFLNGRVVIFFSFVVQDWVVDCMLDKEVRSHY